MFAHTPLNSRIPPPSSAQTLCTLVLTQVTCGRSVHVQSQAAVSGNSIGRLKATRERGSTPQLKERQGRVSQYQPPSSATHAWEYWRKAERYFCFVDGSPHVLKSSVFTKTYLWQCVTVPSTRTTSPSHTLARRRSPLWDDGSVMSAKPPHSCFIFLFLSFSLSLSLPLYLCLYVAQGVGVSRSRLARVLFRTPIDGPGLQPTPHNTVKSVLSCPLCPHRHRMCVIAKRPGCLHWLATCSRTWTFLRRLHIKAHRFLCLTPIHLRKPRCKKLVIVSPETQLSLVSVTMRVFRTRRADLAQWCHGKIMHKALVSCSRCRRIFPYNRYHFVHHSNFRRPAKKNLFPKQRHAHS